MALVIKDRVQETATANTTVSFTLLGAVAGYQSFSTIGNTNTVYYASADVSGNWEVGVGTWATGGTLTRTTILSSSNAGSAVTFSGTVTVFGDYPAGKAVYQDATGLVTIPSLSTRAVPRAVTTTSSATPTINTDVTDIYGLTALAVNITSFTTNLTGTPTDGQKLWIYIVGTATRTIAWGAKFEASSGVGLPVTTSGTTRLDVGLVWNAASAVWRCVAVA